MNIVKTLGKAVSALVTAALVLVLGCNVYTIAARQLTGDPQPAVFGWSWAVVISGSMEPEIRIHDLVIVHREDSYAVGDIIAYESGSSVVTHRIVAETPEGYTTRGDANNAADADPVPREAIVGKVNAIVPKVGLWIGYLRTPLGMLCIVLSGAALFAIPVLQETDSHRRK